MSTSSPYTLGPIGGMGGTPFSDPPGLTITRIYVSSGEFVDCLLVTYSDGHLQQHGGSGGTNQFNIVFDSDEFISRLEGTYGSYINTLKIITNKDRTYGPFGGAPPWPLGPNSFTLGTVPSKTFSQAFFGRSGIFLDAIGISGISTV